MGRRNIAWIVIACFIACNGDAFLFAQQENAGPAPIQPMRIINPAQIQLRVNGVGAGFEQFDVNNGIVQFREMPMLGPDGQQINNREHAYRFMRGLIQNELSIIDQLCQLDKSQKQKLVDLAEEQWKEKTKPSIDKCVQQHLWGNIDLDGLAERLVRGWLASTSNREQLDRYDAELADRMLYRKQALLSRWLDLQQVKLNLSSKQMKDIEKVLNENWRDRWFRSLEATFNNSSLLPDIKTVWIAPLLSDAQIAALVARDTQAIYRSFTLNADCPVKELNERLQVGECTSSDRIELVPKPRNDPAILNDLEEQFNATPK